MKYLPAAFMAVFLCLGAGSAVSAPAQVILQCYETKSVLKFLSGEGLAVVRRGITSGGTVMELWRNADSTKFMFTDSRTDGVTCLLGSGGDLETVLWYLKPKGPDA